MNKKTSLIVTAVLLLLLFVTSSALASTVDTRPSSLSWAYLITTGPDSAGGTFTADDLFLNLFTLEVGLSSGVFRAIVLDTDVLGFPNSLLWESPDITGPNTLTEFSFNPIISLTIGNQYYIGFDTGLYTTTAGGNIGLGLTGGDVYPGGKAYENLNGSGWNGFGSYDITTLIQMDSTAGVVPVPGALLLLGSGLIGLVGIRKKIKS